MASESLSFPLVTAPSDAGAFPVLNRVPTRLPSTSRPKLPPSKPARTDKPKVRPGSYQSLGLNGEICAAFQAAGYNFPTPIQRKAIPPILSGADVVAMARTGSGKTAAFLAPIIHVLSNPLSASTSSRNNGPRALIISPTRELALQTLKFSRLYSKNAPVRTSVVVGGTPLHAQFEALAVCPPLVIATPGRLLQILAEMGSKGGLTLSTTQTLVLDEADRLFEGTLAVETAALLAHMRDATTESLASKQTILVSATMPRALAEFSRTKLRPNLTVLRLDVEKSLPPTLATSFLLSRGDFEKDAALQCLLRRLNEENRTAVVFAATHRRVEYISALIRRTLALKVVAIHGSLDNTARLDAVAQFRKNTVDVLVVTDVAARGIDLPLLDVVVNYDMPATPKLFVHRVGRVARAGRFGMAFLLVTPDEIGFMLDVFLFIGRRVEMAGSEVPNHDAFTSHAYAIESSFIVGCLPKTKVDEEVELTRNALENIEIDQLHSSARNAHKLYTKTRGCASGESIRRAKLLFATAEGGRKNVEVHPWFAAMESGAEKTATQEAARLSTWRPRECMVAAPRSILKRKRAAQEEDKEKLDTGALADREMEAVTVAKKRQTLAVTMEKINANTFAATKKRKMSARQLAMEQERKQFFLPTRQDSTLIQTEKAFKVSSGGKMSDDMRAYREIHDAAVDVNGDGNVDLLRAKHTSSDSAKYWDRVTKKFVKGGVTDATSKRNLHVASREAKARAKAGESYGTENGVLFKKWLLQNRKTVEKLAEQVDSENTSSLPILRGRTGLESNDFRKGAFGRSSRIAAAARNKAIMSNGRASSNPQSELKTKEEIKKARKMQAKAEARRVSRENKKKGKSMTKKQPVGKMPNRGGSKSKLIIRRG